MKRLSLYLFLILFTLQTPSQADDIRDFQIEGMSIGDSLLDYFSEEEINGFGKDYYPASNKFHIKYIRSSRLKTYDSLTMSFKENSNKISGNKNNNENNNIKTSNKNNFLSDTNITDYYQVIDLTTVRDLNKKLPELKKQKNSIYFSTAAGFQGLESEIVIYIDPLEQNILKKIFELSIIADLKI